MCLTHPLVELILIFFHYIYAQPLVHIKFMHLVTIICYSAHICVSSKIEGVRIPCCAHCIQMQTSNLCTYLGELPRFICITNVCSSYYFIYLDILIGLNIFEGIRMPYLCIVYSNANILNYARTLGSFLISFRSLLLSYHDILFLSNRIFDCLLYLLKLSSPCYLCAIFDPQYSLTSFKYSSLDMCI